MSMLTRTDQSIVGRWWWTVDRGLLAALAVLICAGVMLVASASPPVAERIGYGQYHFIVRHLIVLAPAIAIMLVVSMLETRNIWRLASIILAGSLLGMVITIFAGTEIKGAQRWIGLFGFSLQPSEFAKMSFVVVTGWLISRQKEKPDFPAHIISAAIFGLLLFLLLLQPDIGMAFVVTCMLAAQLFLAGLPLRYLFLFGVGGVVFLVSCYFVFGHFQSRMDRFLDPSSGDTYQIDRAIEAFHNGGLLGTGPGQGTVKLYLPDGHADFIFAVAAEEMGLWFIAIIIFTYGFILLRGFNHLMGCRDIFVLLAAGGLLVMFGLQALIHMGANVHLLPAKGMTLPFISYGGSSLLSTALGMGMILALTRRQSRTSIARGGLAYGGSA